MTLAKIAHNSRETLQFSVFVSERHRNSVRPELRTVLSGLPAFCPRMAFGLGPIELLLELGAESIFDGIEKRYVFIDSLRGPIAVNSRRSRIPGGNTSVDIQKVERVVLYP